MPQLPFFPFLLLIIFFSSNTTLFPCIFSASTVTHLPGFNDGGALPFHLETGYVSVDDEVSSSSSSSKVELFYYFVESERKAKEDPLILWLTGGPGCTSFYAFATDIGPLRFRITPYNGTLPSLAYNPYAWTKFSSIIFLDWPAMSGFSFLKNGKDYYSGDDIRSSKEICNFLEKWFLDHPKFKSNPFYVAGNSYGGKIVPIVALKIAEGIEAGRHLQINLKGYICGNPVTGAMVDYNSRAPYAHGMGIIPDELFEAIQRSCPGEDIKTPRTGPCMEQIKIFRGFLNELMLGNFLTPKCEGENKRMILKAHEADRSILELKSTVLRSPPPIPDIKCTTYPSYLAYHWANDNDTREALRIKEGTVKEWQICNPDLIYKTKIINSSIPYHHAVITKGYRALIFSGDHDLVVPYSGTLEWIASFNLSVVEPWRSWYVDSGQVGGYTVSYSNNLTFATVKGGGHDSAKDRTKETWALFRRWISYKPL